MCKLLKTVLQVVEVAKVPHTSSYVGALKVISGYPRSGMILSPQGTTCRWKIIDTAQYIPDLEKERDSSLIMLRMNRVGGDNTLSLDTGVYLSEITDME